MAMNKITCVTDIKNTGICGCFFDPKLLFGGILVPLSRVFTDDELSAANIAATIEALINAPKAERGYPFMVWDGVTDSTEEPTVFTTGYGTPIPVREGSYNWIFNFYRGGVDLSNALRSFNGLTGKYGLLIAESTNKMIGTKKLNGAGVLGTAGIVLQTLYTYPWKLADGSNPALFRTQIAFRPEQINEAIAFHAIDMDDYVLASINGLETVELNLVDDSAPVYTVNGSTECGTIEDLYDLFADEFENETAWVGLASDDGEALTPTTAVKNAANNGWVLTFAEAVSQISLAAPTVLAAAPINVSGYDSDALLIGS